LLLDLELDDPRDVLLVAEAFLDEDLAQFLAVLLLELERQVEVVLADLARRDQELAQLGAAARGEKLDLAVGEIYLLLALAVVDDQGARVPVHGERLKNVAQVQ